MMYSTVLSRALDISSNPRLLVSCASMRKNLYQLVSSFFRAGGGGGLITQLLSHPHHPVLNFSSVLHSPDPEYRPLCVIMTTAHGTILAFHFWYSIEQVAGNIKYLTIEYL